MKDRMKVYHGIPKSIPDENTVFYASFDGSLSDSNNLNPTRIPTFKYESTATGYGIVKSSQAIDMKYNIDDDSTYVYDAVTVDCILNIKKFSMDNDRQEFLWILSDIKDSTGYRLNARLYNNKLAVTAYRDNNPPSAFTPINYILPKEGIHHIRVTVNNYTVSLYVDGKLVGSTSIKFDPESSGLIKFVRVCGDEAGNRNSMFVISDLHISNIDRGDFFPNLPQDFIEGKAIIKERFGQQQIKGDPMYSQVTELRVPTSSGTTSNYYTNVNTDGLYTCINNPELSADGADNWELGKKFKIKGLNGEIITGVIDTDTALARVVASENNTFWIKLDDVSKFKVNDTVRHLVTSTNSITGELTVQEINLTEKSIKVNIQQNTTAGNYIFETTTSSSSPVVKSQDGQTVAGTWSGLGTNEATFTLGENTPSLSGKDLYVTYSLNISSNNSHFLEIPYSVDKAFAETGLEMKPVTEIVIEDDFKGIRSNRVNECHHKVSRCRDSFLAPPDSSLWEEHSDYGYSSIYELDGSDFLKISTDGPTIIPQQMFTFNLIEMVEKKIGEIPSSNKILWLKNNLESNCVVKHYGYGVAGTTNKLYMSMWDVTRNQWYGGKDHSSGSVSEIRLEPTTITTSRIDANGCIHFIIYGNAPNGNESIVYTDYIHLSIKLKLPSNYQALYCDNKRAREDACNPVLVQKETKTVQRLMPSKECFVTESKSGMNRGASTTFAAITDKCVAIKGLGADLTTYGTGNPEITKDINPALLGCIARFDTKIPSYMFTGELLCINKNYASNSDIWHRYLDNIQTESNRDNRAGTIFDPTKYIAYNMLALKPYLFNDNGEIKLDVYYTTLLNKNYDKEQVIRYSIPNRPLIK